MHGYTFPFVICIRKAKIKESRLLKMRMKPYPRYTSGSLLFFKATYKRAHKLERPSNMLLKTIRVNRKSWVSAKNP
jgi:hypothetical protein